MGQRPCDSSFGFSAGLRADIPIMALPKVTDFRTLNISFKKLNSFFSTSQQPLRVAVCYESSGPKVYALDVIIQL